MDLHAMEDLAIKARIDTHPLAHVAIVSALLDSGRDAVLHEYTVEVTTPENRRERFHGYAVETNQQVLCLIGKEGWGSIKEYETQFYAPFAAPLTSTDFYHHVVPHRHFKQLRKQTLVESASVLAALEDVAPSMDHKALAG